MKYVSNPPAMQPPIDIQAAPPLLTAWRLHPDSDIKERRGMLLMPGNCGILRANKCLRHVTCW